MPSSATTGRQGGYRHGKVVDAVCLLEGDILTVDDWNADVLVRKMGQEVLDVDDVCCRNRGESSMYPVKPPLPHHEELGVLENRRPVSPVGCALCELLLFGFTCSWFR